MRLVLLAAIAALVMLPAGPALAQSEQDASNGQDCETSSESSSDEVSSSGSESGTGNDADCPDRSAAGDHDGEGREDRDVHQIQVFEGDRIHRHVHRRDRHHDRDTSFDELDCTDFSSQEDAQRQLDSDTNDPHNLDSDNDGSACEDFFVQAVSVEPRGGVETGGGGTLGADGSSAGTVAKVVGPLAVLLLAGGLLGLRRGRLS